MHPFAKSLIGFGLFLIFLGLAWNFRDAIGLGNLPGDIVVRRGNARIYAPITSCILVSLVFSLLTWIFRRLGS
jgi:hypothetical protein